MSRYAKRREGGGFLLRNSNLKNEVPAKEKGGGGLETTSADHWLRKKGDKRIQLVQQMKKINSSKKREEGKRGVLYEKNVLNFFVGKIEKFFP